MGFKKKISIFEKISKYWKIFATLGGNCGKNGQK
jgi:hypothetical protein